MGVQKHIQRNGNNVDRPVKGNQVTMEYTGWLYDESQPGGKGSQFDSSVGRGDFVVASIGSGMVIRGWDEGILGPDGRPDLGMSLGEKATLVISSDFGYGTRGFPGHIPPNATLIFDVELKAINNKRA